MTNTKNFQAQEDRRDFAEAVRRLLRHPLLTAKTHPEAFTKIRRNRDVLIRYFENSCGWRLDVDTRAGYARLVKVRTPDPRRPLKRLRGSGAPYDRRRYVVLCVTCAELLERPVTTIGILAAQVAHACAADPGVPAFDTADRSDRIVLVDVLKTLEDLGVVELLDGSTDGYIASESSKALLRADGGMLMGLIAAPQAPSRVTLSDDADTDTRIDALLAEPRYELSDDDTEAARNRRNLRSRHRIMRRLFEDPVVHYDELTEDELAYLRSPTGRRLFANAADIAGMILEERAEGIMLVDPDGIATDESFPDSGTYKQTALLLLDALTATGAHTVEELHGIIIGRMAEMPTWAKTYRPDGTFRLLQEALTVLAAFGLIDDRDEGAIKPKPAAYRYHLAEVKTTEGNDRD